MVRDTYLDRITYEQRTKIFLLEPGERAEGPPVHAINRSNGYLVLT